MDYFIVFLLVDSFDSLDFLKSQVQAINLKFLVYLWRTTRTPHVKSSQETVERINRFDATKLTYRHASSWLRQYVIQSIEKFFKKKGRRHFLRFISIVSIG
jgi:hypothetical protein